MPSKLYLILCVFILATFSKSAFAQDVAEKSISNSEAMSTTGCAYANVSRNAELLKQTPQTLQQIEQSNLISAFDFILSTQTKLLSQATTPSNSDFPTAVPQTSPQTTENKQLEAEASDATDVSKPASPSSEPAKPTPFKPPATSPKANYSVTSEYYYYNWSDDLGNSGSQFVAPITFTYQQGNFDVGLRTAYINSNFEGVLLLDGMKIGTRKGQVSTLSDTSASFAYTLKELSWPIRFNLDLNLPTGRATLVGNEKNAIMDGALVQQTRFGEGFNIAPGISISHAFGNKDVVGLGVSHIFRGQFDPNGDVSNDEIDPGDETVATLQYQHNENNWLLIGGLIYTNYGLTQRGGQDYYRSGDRLDANATLVYSPFERHRVQLSGRYFTQSPNDVVNFLSGNISKETANSNGNALFLSFDWGVALGKQQRHTVHLLADYLNVEANSYDRINDLFNAGRDKFSIGLGYDYALSSKSRFSLQAKYFNLTDNATPVTQRDVNADGLNLYGTLNFSF
ncbi:hypothetical protein GTQ43_03540 [Nostoc sp. KVJ3]|uniref:hypothetical protein n=1 Tax=Nostoc sp. KVJ3 TaxID=457945 RepID=UPI0022382A13|nr:hypothetical protein [Nostoc sp. KVJ3]MCW5312954.1 hypothetical protein [Nostoc sp. KVJ3]